MEPKLLIWAILSPVLAAVGVGLFNYILNYRAVQAQYNADKMRNEEEHKRIEAKADGLGKSLDIHREEDRKHKEELAGMLGSMNTKLNLLVNGKINND